MKQQAGPERLSAILGTAAGWLAAAISATVIGFASSAVLVFQAAEAKQYTDQQRRQQNRACHDLNQC